MAVNMKAAGKTIEAINPFQPVRLADLTRQTVDAFVTAQKALLDVVRPEQHETHAREGARHQKAPARKPAAGAKRVGQRRTEPSHAEPVSA